MKVAVVTHGYGIGGGVPAVADWITAGLLSRGFLVDVHDLSTTSRDPTSRSILRPSGWLAQPVSSTVPTVGPVQCYRHWGAPLAEVEPFRYLARRGLTQAMNRYDLIQIVAGAPCWANAFGDVTQPKVLQVATTTRSERRSRFASMPPGRRGVARLMSQVTHRMDQSGLRKVNHVLVENREMLRWVERHGQTGVSLVPPGIDVDAFSPSAEWSGSGPVVAVGRLGEARKGWERVIDSYGDLRATLDDAPELVVAGKGELTAEARRTLEKSPVKSSIRVEPNLSHPQLVELLRSGSLFLQGSYEEGLGLAGLEAMACGLPMVATDTAGTREYLESGVNGVLVAQGKGSATGLANGMKAVLTLHGARMSRNARSTVVTHFASDRCLESFEQVYEHLLRGRK